MTSGPVTPARSSRVCRSVAIWSPSCGVGEGSLRPRPARSYTQTRVCAATVGSIHPQAAEVSPRPGSRMTVGSPDPVQDRYSRWSPTSMSCPGSDSADAWSMDCVTVWIAAADRGEGGDRDDRVEHPPAAAARQLPADLDGDPDQQAQQGGRPHPTKGVHGGAARGEDEQRGTAHAHHGGGNGGPALRVVGEEHRQCQQQRPSRGETEEHQRRR